MGMEEVYLHEAAVVVELLLGPGRIFSAPIQAGVRRGYSEHQGRGGKLFVGRATLQVL